MTATATASPPAAAAGLPPGPSAPALVQGVRWAADPEGLFLRSRGRYGDPFTLRLPGQPPVVVFGSHEGVHSILTGDPAVFRAGQSHAAMELGLGQRSVLLLDGDEHARQRRMMLPYFRGKGDEAATEAIDRMTRREAESWPVGSPLKLGPRYRRVALKAILHVLFGAGGGPRFGRLEHEIARMLESSVRWWNPNIAWASLPERLARPLYPVSPWRVYRRSVERADGPIREEIAERRRTGVDDRADVLSALMRARDDDGRALDDGELRDAVVTLLLAGHETSATALSWTTDLLMRHPHIHARAREAAAAGDGYYIDAVVAESLRLRPPLPFAPRTLAAEADVGGRRLPAGTMVVACIYLLHRNPDVFERPDEFDPERFTGARPDPRRWAPFGGGGRRCLGAGFATTELRTMLSALLTSVRLEPARARAEDAVWRTVVFSPRREVPAVRTA